MAKLAFEDAWVAKVDVKKVAADFRELGENLAAEQGPEDVRHLERIVKVLRIAGILGLVTLWLPPWTLIPAALLSISTFGNWTMVGHHVCHGGYQNCSAPKGRWDRWCFAVGSTMRRLRDWPDWMLPEAWNVEHNHLHHYHLNETSDPDLVEQNLKDLRDLKATLPAKYFVVALVMMSWKWFYYAPNTFAHLQAQQSKTSFDGAVTLKSVIMGGAPKFVRRAELLLRVFLPYVIYNFVLKPAPLLAVAAACWALDAQDGRRAFMAAYGNALANLVIADVLTNIHSYIAIVPNHAGPDLYRWTTHCKPLSGAFYIRAVVSSANYSAGYDLLDASQGFLNYQIEHHCFPKLSMLSYQKAMPRVKALCAKHGIPYVQESIWTRLKKTVDTMVGAADMRTLPLEWERALNQEGDPPSSTHRST